jgi:hypothetical protein
VAARETVTTKAVTVTVESSGEVELESPFPSNPAVLHLSRISED